MSGRHCGQRCGAGPLHEKFFALSGDGWCDNSSAGAEVSGRGAGAETGGICAAGACVRTLPFAAAGDGTMEFEQDVAACLRTFENSGEVEAFLGELPPYSVGSLDGQVVECPTFSFGRCVQGLRFARLRQRSWEHRTQR